MNDEQAKKLREPFKAEQIGKLPRLTCRDCSKAQGRVCPKHTKSRCQECGNWISSAHIHLDYVGHAAVTDRLLSVDPGWSWEPLARHETGQPVLQENAGGMAEEPLGLWGTLTVCDVTKPAFGGGKNAKECISDLIRNGAMRFGVGLDLWSKEDLHVEDASASPEPTGEQRTPSPEQPRTGDTAAPSPEAAPSPVGEPEPEPEDEFLAQKKRVAGYWNQQTLAKCKELAASIDDVQRLQLLLIIEGERESPRKTVLAAISKRIKNISDGEPEDAARTPEQAQDGDVPPDSASPSENGLVTRVRAAVAWIAEQPTAVDNPDAWTQTGILTGLSVQGAGAFGSLPEVPEDWLEAIWNAVPEGVRESVDRLGPEALGKLAGQAK